MCIFCEHDAKVVGEYFGYPKCCVDWYVTHQENYGKGDIENLSEFQLEFLENIGGAGYMPCPSHAKRIMEDGLAITDIITDRHSTRPYPIDIEDDEVKEEFEEWLNNI